MKLKRLQERIAELEQLKKMKQLELDYLNVTLDICSEDLGIDLRKELGKKAKELVDKENENDKKRKL